MMLTTLAITVLLGANAPSTPTDPDGSTATKLERVLVHCRSEAMVRGTSILMRDIASIETGDAALRARVGDIRIAGRPALGYNRVFRSDDIMRRLVAAGLAPKQIEMAGANEVVAQPVATILKPNDMTRVCDPVLRAVLAELPGDVEFSLLNKLTTLRVPPGRFDLAMRGKLRDGKIRPSSATIDLEIIVDEEVFRTVPLNYRLTHYVKALRTTRVIKRGQRLDPSNVGLTRIEVSPGANTHLTSFELIDGLVASRDLRNNQNLRIGDAQKPAVVHRNDVVKLIARRGRVSVATKAIALEDGPVGGRIKVRSLSTTKPVQATVYAAGIVVIQN